MKWCVCNEAFAGYSLEEQFKAAAELGFEAIEIAPFTIAQYVTDIDHATRQRIRVLAEDHGLEIAGIHWVLAKTEGFHITHPDPQIRRRTVDYLRALVQFGLDIGAKVMVVGSPQQRGLVEEVTYAEAWHWFAEAMAAAATEGADADFKICIEPLAPATGNTFLFKAAEAIKMAREINMHNVGVIIDTNSGSKTEEDLPGAIRAAGELLFHYHCNDINGRAPGWGRIEFKPIFHALLDIRFAGYCSIEIFDFSLEPREHLGRGLQYLKEQLEAAQQERQV